MRVVVTGANGFVGRELVQVLAATPGVTVVAASRQPAQTSNTDVSRTIAQPMPDLSKGPDGQAFATLLDGADAVIHLAAMTPGAAGSVGAEAINTINVDSVTNLARAAQAHGVSRFVLVSSVRVTGAQTDSDPINEDSPQKLDDAYAASKAAAEAALVRAAPLGPMTWTIVRPPLIYGPGVKGPMRQLAKAVLKGVPLPFGSVTHNQRDMIGVRNLAEFLTLATTHIAAENQLFVVRDGAPLSTRGLIEAIAAAAGIKPRLMPFPPKLLVAPGRLVGKGQGLERLIGDYRIDDRKARRLLNWRPAHPIALDLTRMTEAIIRETNAS
jgi:nucleoside-diphosphate-sugar epimerase